MLFIICILPLLQIVSAGKLCNGIGGNSEFPSKENDYDVRPNLFIDRDNLLGRTKDTELDHKKTFTYINGPYGPSHWAKLFPKCAGKKQSPIDLELQTLKRVTLPKLKWGELYEQLPQELSITNNGHTIILNAKFANDAIPKLEGGPLTKAYNFQQIHFHWASTDHKGAEHTINKKTFPMEMHVVHYRSDLNKTSAFTVENGLCVIGYIFEIGETCNDALANLLAASDSLKIERDSPTELTNLFRLDNLLDRFEKEYVTYYGSLTTPPCYESVIWLISPYTQTLSRKQMEKFRAISSSSKGFGDNFRNIQPLNNRIVNFVN